MKVMLVFGTRPEAIKMCPLILELQKHQQIKCIIVLTGQHREMLDQVMDIFGIEEDFNLHIMKERQTLTSITTSVLEGLENIIREERPEIVLVHGDTTTSMAAALAAFYQKVPVGHVEAGLRTENIYSPFPEEMNRRIISQLSTYFFSPTDGNAKNLKKENISENVYVTGNTVIDSFQYTVREDYSFHEKSLQNIDFSRKIILMTAHRRENLGRALNNICEAVREIAEIYRDVQVIYAVHPNPVVHDTAYSILNGIDNVLLTPPLDVLDMHNLIARSYFVLTDSGGLQEEAPALGKPVLVVRTETERPEAIDAGTAKLIGIDKKNIIADVRNLLDDSDAYLKMAKAVNPYGDGHASERITDILLRKFYK